MNQDVTLKLTVKRHPPKGGKDGSYVIKIVVSGGAFNLEDMDAAAAAVANELLTSELAKAGFDTAEIKQTIKLEELSA